MNVKVQKISESDDPLFKAGKWNEYILGSSLGNETVSIPIDYELEGTVIVYEVGRPMTILRHTRNDIKVAGLFTSSTVKSISAQEEFDIVETKNSIYKVSDIS